MVPLVDQIAGILTQVFMEGVRDRAFDPREMNSIAKDIIERVIDDEQYAVAVTCPHGCDETHDVLFDHFATLNGKVAELEKNVASLTDILRGLTDNTYPYNGWLTFCSSSKFKIDPDGTVTRES
jgi:hypothetical protein